jgi:hypothetical protein
MSGEPRMPQACGACLPGEKTGAKAVEIKAIIAVRCLVKTSLKPARDSADESRLQE